MQNTDFKCGGARELDLRTPAKIPKPCPAIPHREFHRLISPKVIAQLWPDSAQAQKGAVATRRLSLLEELGEGKGLEVSHLNSLGKESNNRGAHMAYDTPRGAQHQAHEELHLL
eukprot:3327676-Rhodomonas_salina.1